MTTRSLYASDPEYKELNRRQMELCRRANPDCHFDHSRERQMVLWQALLAMMLEDLPPSGFAGFFSEEM